MTELFQSGVSAEELSAVLDGFRRQALHNSIGTPEEVAESYVYCMRSSFVTGAIVWIMMEGEGSNEELNWNVIYVCTVLCTVQYCRNL